MNPLNPSSQHIVALVCLAVCTVAGSVRADVVFRADFDAAGQMVTLGGSGALKSRPGADASISTAKPLAPGAGGCLSIAAVAGTHTAEAVLTPAVPASSLDAMTQVREGDRVLQGGLDFFFRTSTDLTQTEQFRPIDSDNRGQGGLRLVILGVGGDQMRVEVLAPPQGLLLGGEGGKPANVLAAHGKSGPIKADTVYHIGLTFETDAAGNVTLSLWAVEGGGEIDVTSDPPVATTVFGIDEQVVTNGFSRGAFNFGKLNVAGAPTTQEFDTLRLYNAPPVVFDAIVVPEPAAHRLPG